MGSQGELIDAINIEDHIQFIAELLSRYEWRKEQQDEMACLFQKIRDKQNDKRLYLAIVGEFTSGKSSFINALLRDDLLKTDILQATTTTSTLIEYGSEFQAVVSYKDGSTSSYSSSQPVAKRIWRKIFKPKYADIKDEILKYIISKTAEESNAVGIQSVRILHFAENLKEGHVIIDTPGINAINERHEQVAANAVIDYADAAIIIVPANAPLGESLMRFLKKYLEPVISKCIFVVNKMDTIPQKERNRMVQYVEQRIKSEFALNKAIVLPYTPHAVLNGICKDSEVTIKPCDQQSFYNESVETEAKVFEVLRQQRLIMQMQKMIVLLENMLELLDGKLRELEKEYKMRHQALIDNQVKDLKAFIAEQKRMQAESLEKDFYQEERNILDKANATKQQLFKRIQDAIFNANSRIKLNKVIRNDLPVLIREMQAEMDMQWPQLFAGLQSIPSRHIRNFEEEFVKLYDKLATLGGYSSFSQKALTIRSSKAMGGKAFKQLMPVRQAMAKESNRNTLKSMGGAGTGALIGTVISPGIGTAIGAAIGGIAGLFLRSSLDKVKQAYYDQATTSLNASFHTLEQEIEKTVKSAMADSESELMGIIDTYFAHYDELVNHMICCDEEEKKELEIKSVRIKKDLSELENRRFASESAKKAFDQL